MMMPRRIFPRSVTARLVAFYCLLLVALGGAFLGVTVLSFHYFTQQTLTDILSMRNRDVWNLARESLDDPARLSDLIERRFSPELQNRFIRIRVGEKVIYQSGDPETGTFSASEVPWLNPANGARSARVGNLMLYSRSYYAPGLGPISIATGLSYHLALAVERRLIESLLIGLPLLLLVSALAGYALMRRALTPLETMVQAADAYTFNDPRRRLPLVNAEPRIAALGMALNRILERLDGAYGHVSRFSADAAHELRTPLSIIRGELEQVAGGRLAPDEAARTLAAALEEMNRLGSTVDSLIVLSRLEGLPGRRLQGAVDLSALADQALTLAAPAAAGKGIELAHVHAAPVTVRGDGEQLALLLSALLDNAVKFTPPGGQVTVETGADADTAFVSIEDTGIGIDPRHHERVFDRFYRAQPIPGDKSPGLGLSLVRAVAAAHGGRASLRSVPDLGSIFRVDLPLLADGEVVPDKAAPGARTART
jgi:signal transduction histidine kinase